MISTKTNHDYCQGAAALDEVEARARSSHGEFRNTFTIYRLANTWVLFLGEDCDSQLKNSIEGIIIKWAYQVGRGSDLILSLLSLSLLFLGGRGAQ